MCNFYDRNPSFKEVSKQIMIEIINMAKNQIKELNIKYISLERSDKNKEQR